MGGGATLDGGAGGSRGCSRSILIGFASFLNSSNSVLVADAIFPTYIDFKRSFFNDCTFIFVEMICFCVKKVMSDSPTHKEDIPEGVAALVESVPAEDAPTSGAGTGADPGGNEDILKQIVDVFYEYSKQFSEALVDVWPECPSLRSYKLQFDMSCVHPPQAVADKARVKLVEAYHADMSPYFDQCTKKSDELMTSQAIQSKIQVLSDIKFYEKWTQDLHQETKDNVWEYINAMNKYAGLYSLYSKVPVGMMSNIQNMATDITTKLESGTMDLSNLNIMDLGQTVMQSMNPEDMQQFT